MRVSSVNSVLTYPIISKNNQAVPQSEYNAVSFCAGGDHYQRVAEKKEELTKDMDFLEKLFGGNRQAEKEAERLVREEDWSRELELEKLKAEKEVNKTNAAQMNAYTQEIIRNSQLTSQRIAALEEAQRGHIQYEQEMFKSLQETTRMVNQALENFTSLVADMQKYKAESDANMRALLEQMQQAQKENNKMWIDILKKQTSEYRTKSETEYKEKTEEVERIKRMEEMYKKMHDIKTQKGFGKVGGYQKEKDCLITEVGNTIIAERSGHPANVPGGILFYGPQGNGKTLFANAFAEQLDCHKASIVLDVDEVANMTQLKKILEKAEEDYNADGRRTIIIIDEFDDFVMKHSRAESQLKSIMDNISQGYHATIFATTNFPEKLDDILIRAGRFDIKVPIAPADAEDTAEIVKFYAGDFADESVKYDEIAAEFLKCRPDEAYSNAKIESIIKSVISEARAMGKNKISAKDLFAKIRESGADISKEAMSKFADNIILMKRR